MAETLPKGVGGRKDPAQRVAARMAQAMRENCTSLEDMTGNVYQSGHGFGLAGSYGHGCLMWLLSATAWAQGSPCLAVGSHIGLRS